MDPGQLITPAYGANSFTTPDETVYTATDSLSVARYKVFQKWSVEFGFNGTFKDIAAQHDALWAELDKMQFAKAAQRLGNLRDGISYAGSGRVGGLELCALFFNAPNENPVAYDHQAMVAKMLKWEEAGVAVDFFFQQAALRVADFYERFTKSGPPAQAEQPPQA